MLKVDICDVQISKIELLIKLWKEFLNFPTLRLWQQKSRETSQSNIQNDG